jgi:hypothetical protein
MGPLGALLHLVQLARLVALAVAVQLPGLLADREEPVGQEAEAIPTFLVLLVMVLYRRGVELVEVLVVAGGKAAPRTGLQHRVRMVVAVVVLCKVMATLKLVVLVQTVL